jgi:hypothetical protein
MEDGMNVVKTEAEAALSPAAAPRKARKAA